MKHEAISPNKADETTVEGGEKATTGAFLDALKKVQAVVEYAPDGAILTASSAFLKATGFTMRDIKGKPQKVLCDAAYAESDAFADLWARLGKGEAASGEFARIAKGGAELRVNASLCPMVGADGTVEKVVEIATFPPKEKGVSASILGKTKAFETSSAPMMMVDREFIVTDINQATVDLMARSAAAFAEVWPDFDPNNIIGTCIDQFHKEPAHQRKMLDDPANLPFKTDITVGDLKFALNVGPIIDDAGAYVGNILEWYEVTEERMNAGLLAAMDRSQAMIEFTPEGQILTANANFCNATGYALEELVGQHHKMLVDEAYADSRELKNFWKDLARGVAQSGQFKRIRKDGSVVWMQAIYNPIADGNGEIFKVVKFASDITEQKKQELTNLRKTTAFDNSTAAMMTVDRDFVVTDVNEATRELLARSAHAFAEVWPSFDPNEIIGTCIDQFHESPEHQRKMLSEPANLPYKTDITIGDFKFALNVGAIFDETGEYVGNMLEWGDVTTERMNAGVLAALDQSQAMVEFTADGQIITANANFCAATGYDLAELEGKHHRMLLDEADAASDDDMSFWKDLANGEAKDGEFKRRAKDGSEIWLKALYNPIVDNNGVVFKVVQFASEITTQVEMRRTAETLSLVANETDSSVMILDAEGRIEYVNPGFVKLTGYASEEVIGKTPGDVLYGPRTNEETKRQISDNMAAKKPFLAEVLNYSKSGETYWVSVVVNPVVNAQGEVERFVATQANVTEVKEAQIDYTCKLDAISRDMATIEFKPDGTIISANENFCAATGYAPNEIEGKHHRMFCDAEYSKSAEYAQLWERLAGGQSETGKFKSIDRHGNEVWLRASYSPIVDTENQVTKVVKYANDITSEIELEKEVTRISTAFVDKASQISEQAGKVAGGAQTLGVTTEEISASIEELSASIDSIAQNGRMSDEIAQRTKAEADVGARAIDRSIESMGLINSSSEKINEIVKVISEIASQTNMLAFNAAIEAARAGQHGLGFSVVADEVRKLAERSSQATKEISNLINETVKRVSQGSEVSREAGEAFKKILDGITETTESISQISIAATEQQTAARDVAEAVQSIVEASEESAIASDNIASSTNELTEGAAELQSEIAKLGV